MIVVSDASPLIALAACNQLGLVQTLYGELWLPTAVFEEITSARPLAPGALEVRQASWIHHRAITNETLVAALSSELDVGEAEAIALAVELRADLLLMDERRGRQVAKRLGRPVIGVLGVLIEAKAANALSEVRPVLESLISQVGFRISPELAARVLEVAGES